MSSVNTQQLTTNDLRKLLKLSSCSLYKSKETDKRTESIESICIQLFSKDYPNPIVITNENGELSNSYPSKIIIPESEDFVPCISRSHSYPQEGSFKRNGSTPLNDYVPATNGNRKLDEVKLKELMSKARVARCRARFPIPVILFKNIYICRSATLSSGAEIYGRSVIDYYTYNDQKSQSVRTDNVKICEDDEFVEAMIEESPPLPRSLTIGDTSQIFSKVRNQDIKLLKYFSVKHICDLMLEKKKVKFGMNVTSSEKADKENRYSDFNIISLPYPGCEFFREFRDNGYCAEGLVYNWNQNFVDAMLDLPNNESKKLSEMLKVNFKDYRTWDVVKLTQNYLKLLLCFIRQSDSSILIHCISGWDRTPLFMSLLRLTLWADGEIHKSLSAIEITYLTVAYDWYLFGHNLTDRLNKGEEIMFFCFQFLKFITDEQFGINFELPTNKLEDDAEMQKRKISVDSYTNGDDFVIESIPNHYGGSLTSLNSNSSLPNIEPQSLYFAVNHYSNGKQEDPLSTSLSPDMENLRVNSNDNLSNSVFYVESSNPVESGRSPKNEMVSTLTAEDALLKSKCRSSPPENNFLYQSNTFHSSTKPVEIPNANKNAINDNNSGSLCRSDSWQFVSDAGSIRDSHLLNQFSSPDSLKSLRKDILDNNSNSPYSSNNLSITPDDRLPKLSRRKKKLLEVRSLFNSAYNSLNLTYNNGCRLTNLVDQFVPFGTFYSTRDTPE